MSYFLEFLDFKVRNAGPFEHADLPLQNQGLVLIKGDNRDEGGSNGAGKSSLFDLLSTSATGTAAKRRKTDGTGGISKNDFVPIWANQKKPNLHTTLRFKRSGHLYEVDHYRGHQDHGTCIKLHEDGIDITDTKKIDDVQKQVLDKLGLLTREWYGSVYLPQTYTQVLVAGTPKEKSAYLAAHFGLTEVDACVKIVDKWVAAVPNHDVSSLREILATCQDQLTQLPELDDLRMQLGAMQASAKQVQNQLVQCNVEVQQHEQARGHEETRKHHVRALASIGYDIEHVTQDTIDAIHRRISIAEQGIRTQASHTELHNKLAQCVDVGDPLVLRQQMGTAQTELQALTSKGEKLARRQALETQVASVPVVTQDKTTVSQALAVARKLMSVTEGKLSVLQTEVNKLKQLADKCPACLRPISPEDLEKMISEKETAIKSFKTTLPDLRLDVTEAEENLRNLDARLRLEQELSVLPEGDLLAARSEYEDLRASLTTLSKNLEVAITRKNLCDQISALPTPVLDDVPILPELKSHIGVLSQARDFMLRHGHVRFSEAALALAQQTSVDLSAKLSDLNEQVAVLMAKQQERSRLEQQSSSLVTQITKHESEQQRLRVLSTLNVVLKDVKSNSLKECAEMVREAIPLYIKQLFPIGDIGVGIDQDDDSLDFYLTKGQQRIAMYLSSGGQEKRIGLAVLMAFAKMTRKQTNIMIADEPYRDIDAPGRQYVYELFRDLGIPSIFITSHDQDQSKEKLYDKVLTVRMQNGRSTLVED